MLDYQPTNARKLGRFRSKKKILLNQERSSLFYRYLNVA